MNKANKHYKLPNLNTELFHHALKTKNLFAKRIKKNIYFKTNAENIDNKGKLRPREVNMRKSMSIEALNIFQALTHI